MLQMISVLILIGTSIASEGSETWNSVHEWGVVVFEENIGPIICGSPWDDSVMFMNDDLCAEAPVVWIHGEPFEGTFRVEVKPGETITLVYPEPDTLEYEFAEWQISTVPNIEEVDEYAYVYDGPFLWAVESWRNVPSLSIFNENSGITENFLYYECTVPPSFAEIFFHWDSEGIPVFSGIPVNDALAFTPYGVVQVALQGREFIPDEFPFQEITLPEHVVDIFSRWAGTELKISEVSALWETWEPAFTESGHYWLVFPIPEEYNNLISKISLETSDNREIAYHRLFLGAVRVSLP